MGVKGLWSLLEPAARPVRLEALAHTRLAVDASIWLYQLLKAMRDANGDPVEDAHILGFYRRVCKLLYYGIWPVFVFDGAAPELKRTTIAERQAARGQRTSDARHAAHQLLQAQLKLQALSEATGLASEYVMVAQPDADPIGTAAQTLSAQKKRKRDEYELPPLQSQALATRAENARDLRMAHPEDLYQLLALAAERPESLGGFEGLEVDTESPAFKALSPEDQHDLVVALKMRSRQTSHGRLQHMLQSSASAMDFSKQQIDLLVKRNTLTQQWLQVTGNDHRASTLPSSAVGVTTGRVAGERNRAYMLARSDQPGGGWTLKIGSGNGSGNGTITGSGEPAAPTMGAEQAIMINSSRVNSDAEESDMDSVEWENVPPKHESLQADHDCLRADRESLRADHEYTATEAHPDISLDIGAAGGYLGLGARGRQGVMAAASDCDDNGSTASELVQVSSEDEDASTVGSSDMDSDSDLMELYLEGKSLGLVSPEEEENFQQRIRERREREEEAILQLPAEQFLDMWARLVTHSMAEAEPRIYDDMRSWLVSEPLDALQDSAWRANRRLDKLPDVQADISEDSSDADSHGAGQAGGDASVAGVNSDLALMQTRVSRQALVANYLTFAQRWRERREAVPEEGSAEAQSDIISIATEDESGGDSGSGPDAPPLSPYRAPLGIKSPDSDRSYHDGDEAQPASPGDDRAMDPLNEEPSTSQQRSLIFEKARMLADMEPGMPAAAAGPRIAEQVTAGQYIDVGGGCDSLSAASLSGSDSVLDGEKAGPNGSVHSSDGGDDSGDEGDGDSDGDLDTSNSKQDRLLRDEQDEYARFVGKLKESISGPAPARGSAYRDVREELERELQELRARVRDSKRDAAGTETDMVNDIRMLLTLFGIPYITAPQEAEAQCAVLVAQELVDGMITDDSDAFLFAPAAGTRVYRHFFQKDRYVEMYSGDDICQDSSLTRRDLV
ncbi:DNA repair protein rad2, partial [Coemansia biformis]